MILLKLELKILFEIKHGRERRYKKYIVFVQLRGVHLLLARVIVERKEKGEKKWQKKRKEKGMEAPNNSRINPDHPSRISQTFGPSIGSGEKETRMSDWTHANGNWRRCAPIWRVFIWQIHSSVHLCGLERFNGALRTGERGKHRIPSANESVHELIDWFEERRNGTWGFVSKKYNR